MTSKDFQINIDTMITMQVMVMSKISLIDVGSDLHHSLT